MNIWNKGLRTVAIVVLVKGMLAIIGSILALGMVNHDVSDLMGGILSWVHLNADGPIAHWLMGAAGKVNNHRTEVALVGFAYGGFKLVEAIGLWYEKRWAEWLVVISTVVCFMPIEIYELWIKVTCFKAGALALNIIIVAFMGMMLRHTRSAPLNPAA